MNPLLQLEVLAREPGRLPAWVQASSTAMRYLSLLAPLAWDAFPERPLTNPAHPQVMPWASFSAACLVKLEETGQPWPIQHKNWAKKGCTTTLPDSPGVRVRHELDRGSEAYKDIFRQRTATERINSQALNLGIERPKLRNARAIANMNTLIYVLINLRAYHRIRQRRQEEENRR